MRDALCRRSLLACAVLVLSALTVAAASRSARDLPPRFVGPSDRNLVTFTNPVDGSTWSAWSYRSGPEYDIAISAQDASGLWSHPVLLGAGNGRDERQPAFAADGRGNLYLAWATDGVGVSVSMRPRGLDTWTSPLQVSRPGERASAPALLVVGTSLVVAYRSGSVTELREIPLAGTDGHGVQDGPDGFPGTGNEETPDPSGGDSGNVTPKG